jgi:hypothetical protein
MLTRAAASQVLLITCCAPTVTACTHRRAHAYIYIGASTLDCLHFPIIPHYPFLTHAKPFDHFLPPHTHGLSPTPSPRPCRRLRLRRLPSRHILRLHRCGRACKRRRVVSVGLSVGNMNGQEPRLSTLSPPPHFPSLPPTQSSTPPSASASSHTRACAPSAGASACSGTCAAGTYGPAGKPREGQRRGKPHRHTW